MLNNADRYLTIWDAVADLGIDVHIAAPNEIAGRLTERTGLTVHPIDSRFLRSGRETWRLYPGLRKIIRSADPDLIHVTTEPWSIVALQALWARRPTVIHGAETIFRSGTRPEILLRSVLCRVTLPRLAGFVGWNSMAIETAIAEGLPKWTPALIAPAEVPEPKPFTAARNLRAAFRSQMGWDDDDLVIGFVGRYVPEKGLPWLVDGFQKTTNPRLRLACFGSGPEGDVIQSASRRSERPIRDHGPMPFDSIPELMTSLDLLVIPSRTTDHWVEQFGRVAIEAMLAGTAIISSDSGALPEVIGDAGVLVAEGDSGALARAMDELSLDGQRRRQLVDNGENRAMIRYTPTVIAERLRAFWEDVLRSGAGSLSLISSLSPPITLPAAVPITSPRTRPVIAVLMASHNRVATTLRCLESLRAQDTAGMQIEIFLVDDASADGTAEAVCEHFPTVHRIAGGGALFWSGAMRLAQIAARTIEPDFLVWLNDDVVLDDDALERLLSAHRQVVETGNEGVIAGGLTDPDSNAITYAAVNRPDRQRPTRFQLVEPTDRLQMCDSMNGNLVLIPEFVFRRLDGFDSSFRHAMSDFDFGLRSTKQGCNVWLAPGTFGTCPRDHFDQPWTNRDLAFRRRVKLLLSPKGLPPGDWLRFTRRHAGRLWPAYFASPYLRFVSQLLRRR